MNTPHPIIRSEETSELSFIHIYTDIKFKKCVYIFVSRPLVISND